MWVKPSPKFQVETPGMPMPVMVWDFVEAESEEFAVGDGIDIGIVRAGAIPRHEEADAFRGGRGRR